MAKYIKVFEACPHCGQKLSPWQQILLSVDRTLMCKNCWYRILLNKKGEVEKSDNQPVQPEEE